VGLPHQPAIVHNPTQQASKHQPDRSFRINAGPTIVATIAISDLAAQPRQVENAIDAHQHMIVRNELPKRPSDEQLQLVSLLVPQHAGPPSIANHSR
jgi:hypothetical protein